MGLKLKKIARCVALEGSRRKVGESSGPRLTRYALICSERYVLVERLIEAKLEMATLE